MDVSSPYAAIKGRDLNPFKKGSNYYEIVSKSEFCRKGRIIALEFPMFSNHEPFVSYLWEGSYGDEGIMQP